MAIFARGYNDSMPTPHPELALARAGEVELPTNTVVVFGEFLADLFPERRVAGGAPFNVACHLQGLGASPLLATRIGQDAGSQFLLDAMKRCGLDTDLLQFDPLHPSGQVDVIVEGEGHRFEIAADQAFDFIDPEPLVGALARLEAGGQAPRLIYFGTLAQRGIRSREALRLLLDRCVSPRFVDLNLRPPWVSREVCEYALTQASFVKLGEAELHTVAGWLDQDCATTDDTELGRCVAARFDIDRLFVTRGENGAWCLCGGEVIRVPSPAPPSADGDTVGAGDAFSAVLIFATLAGWPLPLTLQRAAHFASAVCGIRGATPASPDFYRPFLKDWNCQ